MDLKDYAVTMTVPGWDGKTFSNTFTISAWSPSQAINQALKNFAMNLSDVDSITVTRI